MSNLLMFDSETPEQKASWIKREIERLMSVNRYEEGYAMYLTTPTLDTFDDYDTFKANNK